MTILLRDFLERFTEGSPWPKSDSKRNLYYRSSQYPLLKKVREIDLNCTNRNMASVRESDGMVIYLDEFLMDMYEVVKITRPKGLFNSGAIIEIDRCDR